MNELITATTQATMSSREIAELCEARHNDVVATIERLFAKGVLRESRKTTRTHTPEGGGRPTEVYDLTKRDTLVIVSGYNDVIRARIIDRWQELEEQQKQPSLNPANLSRLQLIQIAMEAEQERMALESKVGELTPKAGALDRIATANGSMCITNAAKTLQIQPKHLFAWLHEHQWIYRRPGGKGWIAYQYRLQCGLLEHKVTTVERSDGSEKVVEQVLVTPKGLAKLSETFEIGQAA